MVFWGEGIGEGHDETLRGDGHVHYHDGDGHVHKLWELIKLYTLNMVSLIHVNYISINFLIEHFLSSAEW